MSHNPGLITLTNCQYRRSRRSRAVKRLDIQTLVKVGGGSNLNFFLSFFLLFFSFDAMAKQTPFRYSADAEEVIQNTHGVCKQKKEEDGHH